MYSYYFENEITVESVNELVEKSLNIIEDSIISNNIKILREFMNN